MRVNIVTPFSRWENFDAMRSMLQGQGIERWHILGKTGEKLPALDAIVWPTHFDVPEGDAGLLLVNEFVRDYPLIPNERYCFLMDDDWYPPGFIEEVAKHDDPLMVCSMKRGDRAVGKHPCWALFAYPDNLHYGHVGFEQGMFTGEVLNSMKATVVPNAPNEDLIINAAQNWKTKFLPNLFLYFNFMEEGRWNK